MHEIELKFQIPPDRISALKTAILGLSGADAQPLAMHAAYLDTADSRLAHHKMALRVRREGRDWVQTFKAGSADAMRRLEDNQPLRQGQGHWVDGRPQADLALHRDPAVRAALAQALGDETPDRPRLSVVYETVFDRHTATIPGPLGSVQLCLDQGDVRAMRLSQALAELEFELQDGQARAVIDAARPWVDTHGLWLDVQSKAYRGTRLAESARSGQPVRCRPVPLGLLPMAPADLPVAASVAGEAWAVAVLRSTLDTVAGNLSEVAWQLGGWEAAVPAWREALMQCETLARLHPVLRAMLGPATWARGQALISALDDLNAAGAIAREACATHWCLDVLRGLNTAPR